VGWAKAHFSDFVPAGTTSINGGNPRGKYCPVQRSRDWPSIGNLDTSLPATFRPPALKPYCKERTMSKLALYVPLEAKPGKEKEVAEFLKSALPLVNAEPGTVTWFAIQEGPSSFAIFDTFDDEAGREAHLNGKVAAALMAKAGELLAKPPTIHKIAILADKLPK
jgi:quinol monooxygenase YgiN